MQKSRLKIAKNWILIAYLRKPIVTILPTLTLRRIDFNAEMLHIRSKKNFRALGMGLRRNQYFNEYRLEK